MVSGKVSRPKKRYMACGMWPLLAHNAFQRSLTPEIFPCSSTEPNIYEIPNHISFMIFQMFHMITHQRFVVTPNVGTLTHHSRRYIEILMIPTMTCFKFFDGVSILACESVVARCENDIYGGESFGMKLTRTARLFLRYSQQDDFLPSANVPFQHRISFNAA